MSVRVMTAAWAVDLPAGDKLVLLALADCANDEGRCWPSFATLCEKTGRCKRSLQESLRALEATGHIGRKENPGKGSLNDVIAALKEKGFVSYVPRRAKSIVALDPKADLATYPTEALQAELERRLG